MECLKQNHIVFLFEDTSFAQLVLNLAKVNNADESCTFSFIMHHIISSKVPSLEIIQNDVVYNSWKIFKGMDLREKQRYKIFLIGCSLLLFADLRDRHDLILIIAIHEIHETLLLYEPLGEVTVLGLCEVNSPSVWIPAAVFFMIWFLF